MIARVYQAINAIAAELAHDGVAKTRLNARDNYLYRSVDDVLERLAPLLAQHRLCILPRVLEREATERQDEGGHLLVAVTLRVAFDLVSAEDGSSHTMEACGEALDAGDKGTAKAMQSAYKYAVLQAFCVPAVQLEDADASSHRLKPTALPAQPAEGWQQWCDELVRAVESCRTLEAVRRLQDGNRPTLAALSRERRELYSVLGNAIATRKAALTEAMTAVAAVGWAGSSTNTAPLASVEAQSPSSAESRPPSAGGTRAPIVSAKPGHQRVKRPTASVRPALVPKTPPTLRANRSDAHG